MLFLLALLPVCNSEKVYNQQFENLPRNLTIKQTEDWSDLFPEIPNCVRKISPIQRDIYAISQTAEYTQHGLLCISISYTLKLPNKDGKYEINKFEEFPWIRKIKVLNFDAFQISSICGNDPSPGSIIVNIDRNKSVSITSYEYEYLITGEPSKGRNSLLKIAQGINYEFLKTALREQTLR